VSAPDAATARANVNVALVKYWGKRDAALNLPAAGSISVTLDGLGVEASVRFGGAAPDRFVIDGVEPSGEEHRRLVEFLDLVRAECGRGDRVRVETRSTVPRAAGLASSAAAFAALALAATRAAGRRFDSRTLSVLARRGSGSAARSIFGGFVEWERGERADGSDSAARPLLDAGAWDLRVVVALVSTAPKVVSSRAGMTHAATSPLYPAWIAEVARDLERARDAIARRDLEALGRTAEHSALTMHAVGLAAEPPLLYWRAATVECIHRVWALRAAGTAAFVTIDAGPQVKVLCDAAGEGSVRAALADTPGVERVFACRLGGGAEVVA
jgi:diphosphomevalonate decarboxylase